MTATSEPDPPAEHAGPIDPALRETEAIRHVTENLAADYAPDHPAAEVEHIVEEKREAYADAPVRDFVPIMVERDTRETLEESDPG